MRGKGENQITHLDACDYSKPKITNSDDLDKNEVESEEGAQLRGNFFYIFLLCLRSYG